MAAPTVTVVNDPALAAQLGLTEADPASDLALAQTDRGLELVVQHAPPSAPELARGKPLRIDLSRIDTTSGAGRSLKQPLIKAVGVRKGEPYRPTVLDATAGLGEDACLLHGFGCAVTCVERHPVVHALLADAVSRAGLEITCTFGDALPVLHAGVEADVVYLDPMFPAERKTMARKPLRLLAWLTQGTPPTDEAALLDAALATARRRVVVKRPRHAPRLANRDPVTTHTGAAVRYDVYTRV